MAHFHDFIHPGVLHWAIVHIRHHIPFALYTVGTLGAMAYVGAELLRVA